MAKVMGEIGKTGLKRWQGWISEEFVPELRGQRGAAVWREMSKNDDVIGAVLFAINTLMRQAYYTIEPGGSTAKDREAAEFVQGCLDDMSDTWANTISEILSFLVYGWSYHEIVYKVRAGDKRDPRMRSKYNDGLIGWRKLPIRSQDSLWEWVYDDYDELTGMIQSPPPDFTQVTIPLEKALHFVTKSEKGNPEGESILRPVYRDWYFKKRIQEIEGIGIERDLAGFPVLKAPEGVEGLWDPDDQDMVRMLAYAEGLVTSVKRDSREGLVLPFGWDLQLITSGSRRQFDTNQIIERYDSRIAGAVLADFILLGHQKVGSFALSSSKTNMFGLAIGAFLDTVCEVFNNQAIPRLIQMNQEHFKGITEYPKMIHSDVETPNLAEVSQYIKDMTSVGVLIPDEGLEDWVRRTGNLPDKVEGAGYYPPPGTGTYDNNYDGKPKPREAAEDKQKQEQEQEDIEDAKQAAAAKESSKQQREQVKKAEAWSRLWQEDSKEN